MILKYNLYNFLVWNIALHLWVTHFGYSVCISSVKEKDWWTAERE